MRLFVAVDLPAGVKDGLDRVVAAARPSLPNAKWVPRDNLHLTLSFLGEVAEERSDAIVEALRGAVADTRPFEATLGGSGAFPAPRRARVLWVGVEGVEGLEGEPLGGLARTVSRALEPLGFTPESRPWSPHLTVARLRTPGDVSRLLPLAVPPASFEVSEVTLFRSRLARPAPRYEAQRRVPFGR